VKWHQDITAWPHTNFALVTLGVYLDDTPAERGPSTCLRGSHEGPILMHRDDAGVWTGSARDADMRGYDPASAVDLVGSAGGVVAVHCRVLHGSRANLTDTARPCALFVHAAADAFAWMPQPTPTRYTGRFVRGAAASVAHLDPTPVPVPPDWSVSGYGSIFTAQKAAAEAM